MSTLALSSIPDSAWPQDPLFVDGWKKRFNQNKPCPYKNCYFGLGAWWQVRVFIGGKTRVLGSSRNELAAVRFSDMATLYFWPYRVRKKRDIVDADLNFTVESARRDLASVVPAYQIFKGWETTLLDAGLISKTAGTFFSCTAMEIRYGIPTTINKLRKYLTAAQNTLGEKPETKRVADIALDYFQQLQKAAQSVCDLLGEEYSNQPAQPKPTSENQML